MKCTKSYNARGQPLLYSLKLSFGDILVAVAVLLSVSSLMLVGSGVNLRYTIIFSSGINNTRIRLRNFSTPQRT